MLVQGDHVALPSADQFVRERRTVGRQIGIGRAQSHHTGTGRFILADVTDHLWRIEDWSVVIDV